MAIPPKSASAETQFDRASWAVLLVALALAGVALAATVTVLRLPADGWVSAYAPPTYPLTYFYGEWATPLRAGDVVVGVAAGPAEAAYPVDDAQALAGQWRAGTTVFYQLQRAGQRVTLPVELHAPTWAAVLRALAHALTQNPAEWSWPLIALFVFWRRPRSQAARLLLLAMVSHLAATKIGWAATTVSLYQAPFGWLLICLYLTRFWTWLFWPTVIWLVLSFPQPVWPITRWPRLGPLLLYGLPTLAVTVTFFTGWVALVQAANFLQLGLLVLAIGLSLRQSYRPEAHPVTRAQASWVALGFALSQAVTFAIYFIEFYGPANPGRPVWLNLLVTLALPVCLAIAILRHRLFDIDVIIRRTLLYTSLTAILALVYIGSVIVLENALRPLTGQGTNQGAIVLSTLASAALFGPLRRRVQRFIDRRFDRRRYNAAQTLAAFGAEARAETNLAELQTHLERVVDETMRPASVQVWFGPGKN